jgi:hypothetical protein
MLSELAPHDFTRLMKYKLSGEQSKGIAVRAYKKYKLRILYYFIGHKCPQVNQTSPP